MFLNDKKPIFPRPPIPSKKEIIDKEATQKPKPDWKSGKLILRQTSLASMKPEEIKTPSSAKFKLFQ
jgi:hypothetical protein